MIRLRTGPALFDVRSRGNDRTTPSGPELLANQDFMDEGRAEAAGKITRLFSLEVDLEKFSCEVSGDPSIRAVNFAAIGVQTTGTIFEALVASIIEQADLPQCRGDHAEAAHSHL